MIPKFKAYDLKEEQWIEIEAINYIDGDFICITACDDDIPYFADNLGKTWELLQSTGLKDKNNNNLFESDIVEVRTLEGDIYLKGVVKKIKNGFYIDGLHYSKVIPLTDFYFKSYTNTLEIKVVGNKYQSEEHPHLLEEE